MKRMVGIAWLGVSVSLLSAPKPIAQNVVWPTALEAKQKVYVVSALCAVFKQAGRTSAPLLELKVGDEVTVLEKPRFTEAFEGLETPWYRVSFAKSKTGIHEGWVWGGDLSVATLEGDLNLDKKPDLLLVKIAREPGGKDGDFADATATIKWIQEGKEISTLKFPAVEFLGRYGKSYSHKLSFELLEQGPVFRPPVILVSLNFALEVADAMNGPQLIAIVKNSLIAGPTAFSASNDSGGCKAEFIFPTDPGGRTNIVLMKSQCQSSESKGKASKPTVEVWKWTGTKFDLSGI